MKSEQVTCPICGSRLLPGFTQPSRVDSAGREWFACGGSAPEPWGCYGAHLKELAEQRKRGHNA